jgi:hypothetical protein
VVGRDRKRSMGCRVFLLIPHRPTHNPLKTPRKGLRMNDDDGKACDVTVESLQWESVQRTVM